MRALAVADGDDRITPSPHSSRSSTSPTPTWSATPEWSPAAISGVETIDGCLRRVVQAAHEVGGVCVITADHGNGEHMLEADDRPNTGHSLNRVPLIVTARRIALAATGTPADVAPMPWCCSESSRRTR